MRLLTSRNLYSTTGPSPRLPECYVQNASSLYPSVCLCSPRSREGRLHSQSILAISTYLFCILMPLKVFATVIITCRRCYLSFSKTHVFLHFYLFHWEMLQCKLIERHSKPMSSLRRVVLVETGWVCCGFLGFFDSVPNADCG